MVISAANDLIFSPNLATSLMEVMNGGRRLLLSTPQQSTVDSQRAKVTTFIHPKKKNRETCRHVGKFSYNLKTWWKLKKKKKSWDDMCKTTS